MKSSVVSVLRHSDFRKLWVGYLGTVQGYMTIQVSVAWVMTTLTDSPALIALVQASISAPIVAFSMIAGVFADSYDRRKQLLFAQGFIFLVVLVLAATQASGVMTWWLLLCLTFLIGTGIAVNNPAWQASIGDLVPRDEIRSAVALNNIANNLARSAGPAVSGVLLVVWPAWWTLALASLGYAWMFYTLIKWKRPAQESTLPRETFGSALLTGIRYTAMAPDISSTIGRVIIFAFGSIAILALLPALVTSKPGGSAFIYGLLLSVFGGGAMIGALFNRAVYDRLGGEGTARLAFLGFGSSLVVLALADNFWLMALPLPLAGATWVSGYSTFNSTIQLSTARWVVGRVMSMHQTGVFTGVTLGSISAGMIAAHTSPSTALLVSAGVLGVGAAIGFIRPVPEVNTDDLDAVGRFNAPAPNADIDARSGPIMVTIAYQVLPEKLDAFFSAISVRRQARRRDGARNWTLYQDVVEPQIWLETYQVTNWVEYVRHNERQTLGDQNNLDELRQFLATDPTKSVHRYVQRPTHRHRLNSTPLDP